MPTDPAYESEWQTRKNRIDTRLRALGWQIVPFDPARSLASYPPSAITEYATDEGPADYALCVGGKRRGQPREPRRKGV